MLEGAGEALKSMKEHRGKLEYAGIYIQEGAGGLEPASRHITRCAYLQPARERPSPRQLSIVHTTYDFKDICVCDSELNAVVGSRTRVSYSTSRNLFLSDIYLGLQFTSLFTQSLHPVSLNWLLCNRLDISFDILSSEVIRFYRY